jgi:hypothetical protein
MKQIMLSLFAAVVLLAIGLFVTGDFHISAASKPTISKLAALAQESEHKTEQAKFAVNRKSSAKPEYDNDAIADGDRPPALARHMQKLMETIPGFGGEGSAGSAAEYRFQIRAYPLTDISVDKTDAARSAHATVESLSTLAGRAAIAGWISLGPKKALYPFSKFRNSFNYVPNAYFASGRTTALAIDPNCVPGNCRMFATPAGGGLWRTDDALKSVPTWTYLSGHFGINAAGSVVLEPSNSNVVWVGTGEANASSDSEAGVGLYRSTDGGNTWSGPIGKSSFNARAVGSIAISPVDANTIYAASTRAVRGISAVAGGAVSLAPGAPPWGLYKSSDGGATWTFVFNGASSVEGCKIPLNVALNLTPCSPRGVRRVVIDPSDPNTIYASAYARGVWRSNDGGSTWTQIFAPIASGPSTSFTERAEIAAAKLKSGKTRMYLSIGQIQAPPAQLFRSDDVASGTPSFELLTSSDPASPLYGSFNFCTGQCWYDNFVYTPPGYPDVLYLGGSYQYGETGNISNGRAVVLSTDAGGSFTDMTMDATDPLHPNGMHPDQHSIVTNPSNPFQFFETDDGGMIRSSGSFADISGNCSSRGLSGSVLARCQQLLARVPTLLTGINQGVDTLQFQSLSVSPFDSTLVQGGTQDNGTWQSTATAQLYRQTIFGDGGQSGFDIGNPKFRFHTYYAPQVDVNFSNGATWDWNWIADPIVATGGAFYIPIINDPAVSKTMYAGTNTVYRTKTDGLGSMTVAQLRKHCNEFTGDFHVTCGDWVPLGSKALNSSSLGSRAGGSMAQNARTASDTSTMWAATSTGRVFVSKNVDAEPASSVTFTRIDTTSAAAPNRFVSGTFIDPANSNHAWISYSGYNASTPSTPGHVFEVTYDPTTFTATFTDRSYDLRDLPITDVALDSVTGDLYASSDFGVYRLSSGTTSWKLAAPGMPKIEITGLTIVPGARKLYASSHGRGAWLLNLP